MKICSFRERIAVRQSGRIIRYSSKSQRKSEMSTAASTASIHRNINGEVSVEENAERSVLGHGEQARTIGARVVAGIRVRVAALVEQLQLAWINGMRLVGIFPENVPVTDV